MAIAGFLFLLAALDPCSQLPAGKPNVLLVIADDFGVDTLAAYGEGTDPPLTPRLDALAAGGLLFRNATANPNCSPTRATILTGRYGFRTGIGDVITSKTAALSPAEVTLPELLELAGAGYEKAAFGKWHLGNETNGAALAPNVAGFDHYDGNLLGDLAPPPPASSYFMWQRTVDGTKSVSTTYATTAAVDSALAWIQSRTQPWFCYLAFNAPHFPYHAPPAGLYYEDLSGAVLGMGNRPFYKAMVEALDTELGRLLDGLDDPENTMVIFLGDNGTPPSVTIAPFLPPHAKPSVYEGGVNVPLLISGPLVTLPGTECQALVNTTDLFATVAELAGVDPAAWLPGTKLDSISLVPYLLNPFQPSQRIFSYAERFRPVGATGAVPLAHRSIRDERYKVVSRIEGYEFYDLQADPFEQVNLVQIGLTPAQAARFDALVFQMDELIHHP